ncbi:crotonyl-CoA carboxylase/reductase [Rhodoplanes sp. SY1]|uniref:crotonyl-CoA carboxylase/reductase n=1 Tax=Rhodoplanes sp. SY1 TaxID=3166646 RepID=UPI0038B60276
MDAVAISPTVNARLHTWGDEMAALYKPDQAAWVDGSKEEHDRSCHEDLEWAGLDYPDDTFCALVASGREGPPSRRMSTKNSSTSSSTDSRRKSSSSVSFCAHDCGVRPTVGSWRTRTSFAPRIECGEAKSAPDHHPCPLETNDWRIAMSAVAQQSTLGSTKKLYEIGEAPPLGHVPAKMHAWLIRAERFGTPLEAFQKEVVDTPTIADDEVLVYVMAAGINYNNVWAGLGVPINVIAARNKAGEPEPFHIGGSDASGIVYKVGKNVTNVDVGDEVVLHCGTYSPDCRWVKAGGDPMYSPTFRIWGYETNFGSFAQFTRVKAHQCMPKPQHMTWEASASYTLVAATAWRMLHGWGVNAVKKGDVVLVWGGAGGLGSMAIQIAKAAGATSVAVVSGEDKFDYCMKLGATGCINRNEFEHWGLLPHWKDNAGYAKWLMGVRAFGSKIWDVLGEKRAPNIVFEHPGETTIPTSIFVCETGGMVVVCAGTTGYNATVDLRYLWMRQKRLQGSHFANTVQSNEMNQLAFRGQLDPCLSRAFTYDEIPLAHQLMYENKHPHGNMAVLVGAKEFGLGVTAKAPIALEHPVMPRDDVHTTPHPYPMSIPLPSVAEAGPVTPVTIADDGTRVVALMHRGIIGCASTDTVGHVAKTMIDNDIHAVVVMDGGKAVGVVSQTDLVLARQGRTSDEARALLARDIMTPGCATCDADALLSEAVSLMTGRRMHRLVVTENGRPVGVLSMTDVVRKTLIE